MKNIDSRLKKIFILNTFKMHKYLKKINQTVCLILALACISNLAIAQTNIISINTDITTSKSFEYKPQLGDNEFFQFRFSDQNLPSIFEVKIDHLTDDNFDLVLNQRTIIDYYYYSCYLPEGKYEISLQSANENAKITLQEVKTFVVETMPEEKSQCGPTDDRVLSSEAWVGRNIFPSGQPSGFSPYCSIGILSNGSLTMSGHCITNVSGALIPGSFFEVNVPLSNSDGTINIANANDQFPIVVGSNVHEDNGCNRDYCIYRAGDNANTGLNAAMSQNSFLRPTDLNPSTSFNIKITGFGDDGGTRNNVQQTHNGPNLGVTDNGNSGIQIDYQPDTFNSNSGSPIQRIGNDGFTYGIHNCGGCGTDGSGSNKGVSYRYPGLHDALNTYFDANSLHIDLTSNTSTETGTIFKPFDTLEETQTAASSTVQEYISIVKGNYDETNGLLLTKPMKLKAPVGDVLIY